MNKFDRPYLFFKFNIDRVDNFSVYRKRRKRKQRKKTEVIVCFENKVHEHLKAIVPSLFSNFFVDMCVRFIQQA